MHRCPTLATWLADELLPVADAMADGSYWSEIDDGTPPEYDDYAGNFEVGGGD